MTGRKEPMLRYRNAYQEVDHMPMFAPVTKASMDVAEARELPHLLAQAFRMARDGSPRPVHLDLNGLGGEILEKGGLSGAPLPEPELGALLALGPLAPAGMIEAATARLVAAERPVMVVGAGAIQAGAQAAVRALAEGFDIPVATSLGGRGIVPTTHPLHIGTVGTYSAPPGNRLVAEADLVIFVGCHAGDQPTSAYTVPAPGTAIARSTSTGGDRAQLPQHHRRLGLPAPRGGRPCRRADDAKVLGCLGCTCALGGRRMARRDGAALHLRRRADPGRAAVPRDLGGAAGKRGAGGRHRLFRHLDGDAARSAA